MPLSDVSDVCRLCHAKDDLVWVFNSRFEKTDMNDIVAITVGIEISRKDIVSQKICDKCCETAIKFFEFRRNSRINDIILQNKCIEYLKTNNVKIPNTEVTIKNEVKFEIPKIKEEPKEEQPDMTSIMHPSVKNLFDHYPQIKLPNICLKSDIAPFVSLPIEGVEHYFKSRNLDFNYYTKLALKSGRVATKKTSALANPNSPTVPKLPTKKKENSAVPSVNIKINPEATSNVNSKISKNSSGQSKLPMKVGGVEEIKPKITKPDAENASANRKRKFSESQDECLGFPKTESFKKPTFIELLGLTPSSSAIGTPESPAYVANVSVPLHICDICNSVQYSAKDLKKHQNKHLRCQFCKMKFRSLEGKDEHLEKSCIIKNTMRNLPDVVLRKIEYSKRARRKYPDAFVDFPPLKSKKKKVENTVPEPVQESTVPDLNKQTADDTPDVIIDEKQNEVEIIEILSDDEDSTPAPNGSLLRTLLGAEVSKQNGSQPNSNVPSQENIVYNTVSVVKPDIRIKGNSMLDNVDSKLSDTKFLKELLVNYKPYQMSAEKEAQTILPSNSSICPLSQADYTTELKDLKQQMFVYKIPVVIKNGPFNVTYSYQMESKQPKKLCLWNDLTPIDIKTNKVTVPSSICASEKQGSDKVNFVENNFSTSTGTSSSCDVPNVPVANTTATTLFPVSNYATAKSLTSPPISNPSLQTTALTIYNPTNTVSVINYSTNKNFVTPQNSDLPLQTTTVTNYNPVNNTSIPMNNYTVYNKSFIPPSNSAVPRQTTTVSNYNPENTSALTLQTPTVSNYNPITSSALAQQTTTVSNYNPINSSALTLQTTTVSNFNPIYSSALTLQTTTVSNYNPINSSALTLQATTVSNFNPIYSSALPQQTTTVSNFNVTHSSALSQQITTVSNYNSINSSALTLQTTTVSNFNPIYSSTLNLQTPIVSNYNPINSSALPQQSTTVSNYNPINISALTLQTPTVSNFNPIYSSALPQQTTTVSNFNVTHSSALSQQIATVSNYNSINSSIPPPQATTLSNYNPISSSGLPLQTTTVSNYNPVNSASVASHSVSFPSTPAIIVNEDSFLNSFVQTSTSMDTVPVTSTLTSASENHSIAVGTIRVKNVWELT